MWPSSWMKHVHMKLFYLTKGKEKYGKKHTQQKSEENKL